YFLVGPKTYQCHDADNGADHRSNNHRSTSHLHLGSSSVLPLELLKLVSRYQPKRARCSFAIEMTGTHRNFHFDFPPRRASTIWSSTVPDLISAAMCVRLASIRADTETFMLSSTAVGVNDA